LVTAFNDMLSELAAMRAQESSDHLELGRVARLTMMGAMTASIAHEINQPLAAIATNASAALRWLTRTKPEVDEALAALRANRRRRPWREPSDRGNPVNIQKGQSRESL